MHGLRFSDYSETDSMNSKTKDSGTEKEAEAEACDKNDRWEKDVNNQKKYEEIHEHRTLAEDAASTADDEFQAIVCDFRQEVDISEAQKYVNIGLELEEQEQEQGFERAGVRVDSSAPSFLMITPQIHIQGASPVVLSPTDDSSTMFSDDHGGMVDMEKVCEQAAMELAFEAESASYSSSDLAKTAVSKDEILHIKEADGDKEGDDKEFVLSGARGLEPLKLPVLPAEDQDDGMGISFEEDAGNVPLSPTDYSLMDESEVYSIDVAKDTFSERSALEEKDMFSDYAASSVAVGRLPSPSDYTLLTESLEGSDLIGMTEEQVMTEDVFATSEPVEPSVEGYSAFMEFSGNKMTDVVEQASAGRTVALPPVEGISFLLNCECENFTSFSVGLGLSTGNIHQIFNRFCK